METLIQTSFEYLWSNPDMFMLVAVVCVIGYCLGVRKLSDVLEKKGLMRY